MKKIKKIILVLLLIIITLIVIIIISAIMMDKVTVQHVTKNIETVEGAKEPLSTTTSEIYCEFIDGESYGDWVVVGKDGVLFEHDKNPCEEVIVVGNVPKKLNRDISPSIFVFKGKYLAEQKIKIPDNAHIYNRKTFESENWYIKYPIKRHSPSGQAFSTKDGFSLGDIIDAREMPIREIEKDDK
ncbi:hypothetical protein [Clostridium saccharobutylicum]|uniref:Uncharacterized protein n=1 Tax=Clostridium saccharobutylicum TaxID=169679 RepID=A0A1S8N5G4_CLOSA|nr:hypothetical protein [Clostridium saccharobutylicum]OOM11665.1 hypothetical protein CLOSAC_20920 [Clostridium saccharobutylicum]